MDNQEQPQINFATPAGVESVVNNAAVNPVSAELPVSPTEQQTVVPPNVYVYPTGINVIDVGGEGDILKFEVTFIVSTFGTNNSNTTSSVRKVFEISKQSLGAEMAAELASEKVIKVEQKIIENKNINMRMRELAGIPGKGTFV